MFLVFADNSDWHPTLTKNWSIVTDMQSIKMACGLVVRAPAL